MAVSRPALAYRSLDSGLRRNDVGRLPGSVYPLVVALRSPGRSLFLVDEKSTTPGVRPRRCTFLTMLGSIGARFPVLGIIEFLFHRSVVLAYTAEPKQLLERTALFSACWANGIVRCPQIIVESAPNQIDCEIFLHPCDLVSIHHDPLVNDVA